MNAKKLILPALALVIFIPLVSMAASSDSSSFLEKGRDSSRKFKGGEVSVEERAIFMEERRALREGRQSSREEMSAILETGDYDAWLEVAQNNDCPVILQVTRENFAEFASSHKERAGMMQKNRESREFKQGRGVNQKGARTNSLVN